MKNALVIFVTFVAQTFVTFVAQPFVTFVTQTFVNFVFPVSGSCIRKSSTDPSP